MNRIGRKDFLRGMFALSAARPGRAAAVPAIRAIDPPPFDPSRRHQRSFVPTGGLKQLSESLWLFEDCANVYIVRQARRAVLINFATGDVMRVLPRIGVDRIDRVLVTHHHRDHVQGLADISGHPFSVTVPGGERHFFEDVESFWRNVQIYINYDLRSYWNTLRHSVGIDGTVVGGDAIEWNGFVFQVVDTPGATDHAVSYAARIDGRNVVFTGDLIAGPGKVNNWYDLHWGYYGFTQGINASDASFDRVKAVNPNWLLPSHGDPIQDPGAAMRENSRIYATLRRLLVPNEDNRADREMRRILPHLVHLGGYPQQEIGELTSYAILSDSGKAFIYDYGYVDKDYLRNFKEKSGVEHITVTFSHYHDDHLIRVHELLNLDRNVEIWVLDKIADVVENPSRYRLPCLVPFSIKPTRVVRDGERIDWEGYTLEFFHMPGQTEFHQGMVAAIDGKKVMFTGDNTWKKRDESRIRNGPLVPQNEYFLDGGFITCAQKMLQYLPDIVCPAHTDVYSPSRADLEGFLQWAYELRDVMSGLILQPDPNFGMDYRWCHFYPVLHKAAGRTRFVVELRLRNHLFREGKVTVSLKHSPDLECTHPVRTFTVQPKCQVAVPFEFSRVAGYGRRTVVTADLTFNGRRLGEVTEMLVE